MRALFLLGLFMGLGHMAYFASADSIDPVTEYRERQSTLSPNEVLAWLEAGNARFIAGQSNHGGYPTDARERVMVSSSSQRPLAAILSCIDSRTAPETVFDTSVGDLFTARVGGNVINDDVLGSLEISVASGVKLIVVLGHTDCGAIKGACRGIEFEHMTQLLERIKPAISFTDQKLDRDPGLSHRVGERIPDNPKYIAEVSHSNARQSTNQILEKSSYLRKKVASGEILLVSALFDVNSGRVRFDTVAANRHN